MEEGGDDPDRIAEGGVVVLGGLSSERWVYSIVLDFLRMYHIS